MTSLAEKYLQTLIDAIPDKYASGIYIMNNSFEEVIWIASMGSQSALDAILEYYRKWDFSLINSDMRRRLHNPIIACMAAFDTTSRFESEKIYEQFFNDFVKWQNLEYDNFFLLRRVNHEGFHNTKKFRSQSLRHFGELIYTSTVYQPRQPFKNTGETILFKSLLEVISDDSYGSLRQLMFHIKSLDDNYARSNNENNEQITGYMLMLEELKTGINRAKICLVSIGRLWDKKQFYEIIPEFKYFLGFLIKFSDNYEAEIDNFDLLKSPPEWVWDAKVFLKEIRYDLNLIREHYSEIEPYIEFAKTEYLSGGDCGDYSMGKIRNPLD